MAFLVSAVNDNFVTPIVNMGKGGYWALQDTGRHIGRKFEKLTEAHLPKPLAILLQKLFSSIPIGVAYFLLPLPIRLGLWAAYSIINLCGLKNSVIDESLGVSMTLEMLKLLALYAGAKQMMDIATAVGCVFAAGFYFARSRM
jgi:hypothetical protein